MGETGWYVHAEAGSLGPYSAQEVRAWIREDPSRIEWFVWRDGMPGWVSAREIPDLARAIPPPPPPVRPIPPRRAAFAPIHTERETPPIVKLLWIAIPIAIVFSAIHYGAKWVEEKNSHALEDARRARFPDDYPPETTTRPSK